MGCPGICFLVRPGVGGLIRFRNGEKAKNKIREREQNKQFQIILMCALVRWRADLLPPFPQLLLFWEKGSVRFSGGETTMIVSFRMDYHVLGERKKQKWNGLMSVIDCRIIHEMDIQEPEFTSEQVRSVLFTQDAGNQCEISWETQRHCKQVWFQFTSSLEQSNRSALLDLSGEVLITIRRGFVPCKFNFNYCPVSLLVTTKKMRKQNE